VLYLLIIWQLPAAEFLVAAGIMLLFSWMALVDVVRPSFLRAETWNTCARPAPWVSEQSHHHVPHILPNAIGSRPWTFFPSFIRLRVIYPDLAGLFGFGLPAGLAVLGELIASGQSQPQAPLAGHLTALSCCR